MLYLKQKCPRNESVLYTVVPSVAAAIKRCQVIRGATIHVVPDALCCQADKIVTHINKEEGKSIEKLLTAMLKSVLKEG